MRRDRHFKPIGPDERRFESRVVMSGFGFSPTDATIARLETVAAQSPAQAQWANRIIDRLTALQEIRKPQIERELDGAFDEFSTDYFAAQQIYLKNSNTADGKDAFNRYVVQRVNLLTDELSSVITRVPGGADRSKGEVPPVQSFLQNRIAATTPGALLGGLQAATPPVGTMPNGAELFTLSAQSAIEAARTATENGIRYLANGVFQGKHQHE